MVNADDGLLFAFDLGIIIVSQIGAWKRLLKVFVFIFRKWKKNLCIIIENTFKYNFT